MKRSNLPLQLISLVFLAGLGCMSLLASESYAALSVRAFMLHPRSTQQIEFYKQLIGVGKKHHFNTLIIESTGWVHYPNLPKINLPYAFTPDQLSDLKVFAESSGMEVIPYIWLLTHQDEVAKRYQPELMLNESEIDLMNPESWDFEKKLIDDTLAIYNPKKMLIGHDEMSGAKSNQTKGISQGNIKRISPDQYVDHIIKVHNYLKSKGVQTIIWGDMFLLPSFSLGVYPDDGTQASPGYNGTAKFASLLDKLPKDIIIADWHYENKSEYYPSYDFFHQKGFRVWGASWHETHNIQTFSDYVRMRANAQEGMIATTWEFCDIKHSNYVTRIIEKSGDIFYGKK